MLNAKAPIRRRFTPCNVSVAGASLTAIYRLSPRLVQAHAIRHLGREEWTGDIKSVVLAGPSRRCWQGPLAAPRGGAAPAHAPPPRSAPPSASTSPDPA